MNLSLPAKILILSALFLVLTHGSAAQSKYRMGSFEVVGATELTEKLQARWKLRPGTVFNRDYVETFVDKNRSLLPEDFTIDNGVALIKDCPAATVSVHLHLKDDPQHEVLDSQKRVTCPKSDER